MNTKFYLYSMVFFLEKPCVTTGNWYFNWPDYNTLILYQLVANILFFNVICLICSITEWYLVFEDRLEGFEVWKFVKFLCRRAFSIMCVKCTRHKIYWQSLAVLKVCIYFIVWNNDPTINFAIFFSEQSSVKNILFQKARVQIT